MTVIEEKAQGRDGRICEVEAMIAHSISIISKTKVTNRSRCRAGSRFVSKSETQVTCSFDVCPTIVDKQTSKIPQSDYITRILATEAGPALTAFCQHQYTIMA